MRLATTIKLACLAAAFVCGGSPSRGADQAMPEWKRWRVALRERYVEQEFRLFYALDGANALSAEQRTDADHDGVPDKIQNIARQLVTARRLYVEVFKLRHPFESPRYKGRVQYFDVHVAALSTPSGKKTTGSAGDAIVNYTRPSDPPGGCAVLTIDISKDLAADNLTPAHELFHQFQNGYSLFKNSWYTEGTARWAEFAFRAGTGKAGTLPSTDAEKAALFKQSYDAGAFWHALAEASDPAGTFVLPADLAQVRYVGTQQAIIADNRLPGVALVRALFEELGAADRRVSQAEGLDPLDWKEARQRDPRNNAPIWSATLKACRRLGDKTPQMRDFLKQHSTQE